MFLWEYRGTGSGNNFVRKPRPRDNWTGNWWKPEEKRRTNCCEVNWTGVHRQMNNAVCHFDRNEIDKWTILTVSVETKPGEESVEVMCFLSLIDCLQRGTLSTKPGQEPTTGNRNGSFSLSSKTQLEDCCFRGIRVTNWRWRQESRWWVLKLTNRIPDLLDVKYSYQANSRRINVSDEEE